MTYITTALILMILTDIYFAHKVNKRIEKLEYRIDSNNRFNAQKNNLLRKLEAKISNIESLNTFKDKILNEKKKPKPILPTKVVTPKVHLPTKVVTKK